MTSRVSIGKSRRKKNVQTRPEDGLKEIDERQRHRYTKGQTEWRSSGFLFSISFGLRIVHFSEEHQSLSERSLRHRIPDPNKKLPPLQMGPEMAFLSSILDELMERKTSPMWITVVPSSTLKTMLPLYNGQL